MKSQLKKQAAPDEAEAGSRAGTHRTNVNLQDYTPTPEEGQENLYKSNKADVYESLLKRPVAFHRIFKKITKNSSSAIFLSQACYWSNNRTAINRGGWFIKSSLEWEEETGLTRNEQDTARRICKDLGVIDEALRRWNKHATLHFKLNKTRLFELIEQSASLRKTSKLIDCGKPANYIDCGKPANYTHRLPREYSQTKRGGEIFKNWHEAPETYHPYFEACINSVVSLPEPTPKEIKAWIETFDEWIVKGFNVKQITTAGKYAHDNSKIVSSPKSLTWILNSQHARANVRKVNQSSAEAETELARIRKKKQRT